jgi:nucleotide-binding universal stress UspA family protein
MRVLKIGEFVLFYRRTIGMGIANSSIGASRRDHGRLNMKFDHILFPEDFSEHCRELNAEVEWLASRFGSRVTLLHVFEIPASWYGTGEAPLINPECLRAVAQSEEQRLKEYRLNVPGERIERIIAEGGAAWHITNWANEHDVDLIVMGTRGLGNVRGLLMGSVAAKVIHDASCPVWTDALLHPDASATERDYKNLVAFAIAAAWTATVVTIGALGGFAPGAIGQLPAPVLAFGSVVLAGLVAWFLSPAFRDALLSVPLAALVGINAFRIGGIFFLLLFAGGRLLPRLRSRPDGATLSLASWPFLLRREQPRPERCSGL